MRKKHVIPSMVIGITLMLAAPTWADFQTGEDAYLREDYETAMKEWGALAAKGDAEAQNMVGYLYRFGEGVSQDYAEAVKWYRLAADEWDKEAQFNLGAMYEKGKGVPQDYAEAAKWYRLAADQGLEKAAKGLEVLEKEMTPAQLAEAQRLAREWKAKGK